MPSTNRGWFDGYVKFIALHEIENNTYCIAPKCIKITRVQPRNSDGGPARKAK